MIGGLSPDPSDALAREIVQAVAVFVGAILFGSIMTLALWLVSRRTQGSWRKGLRIAAGVVGAVTLAMAVWFAVIAPREW